MSDQDKIQLIDSLIKENKEATIADYISVIEDIMKVEKSVVLTSDEFFRIKKTRPKDRENIILSVFKA